MIHLGPDLKGAVWACSLGGARCEHSQDISRMHRCTCTHSGAFSHNYVLFLLCPLHLLLPPKQMKQSISSAAAADEISQLSRITVPIDCKAPGSHVETKLRGKCIGQGSKAGIYRTKKIVSTTQHFRRACHSGCTGSCLCLLRTF